MGRRSCFIRYCRMAVARARFERDRQDIDCRSTIGCHLAYLPSWQRMGRRRRRIFRPCGGTISRGSHSKHSSDRAKAIAFGTVTDSPVVCGFEPPGINSSRRTRRCHFSDIRGIVRHMGRSPSSRKLAAKAPSDKGALSLQSIQ